MSCTFPTPTARRVALSFTSIYQLLPLLLFTASGALSHNANRYAVRVICANNLVFILREVLRPGSAAAAIEFSTNPCPVVLGCSCIEHDTTIVECHRIGTFSVFRVACYPENLGMPFRTRDNSTAPGAVPLVVHAAYNGVEGKFVRSRCILEFHYS